MGSEENKAAVIEALDRFNDPENRQAYFEIHTARAPR
jgi:hypothetical protein